MKDLNIIPTAQSKIQSYRASSIYKNIDRMIRPAAYQNMRKELGQMLMNIPRWNTMKSRIAFIARRVLFPCLKFWLSVEILHVPRELFQVFRAPTLGKLCGASVTSINIPNENLTNPSIIRIRGRWLIAARSTNYRIVGFRNIYVVDGGIKNIRSRTWLLDFASDLKSRPKSVLLDEARTSISTEIAPNGLEDPRLIAWNNQLWGLWTGGHVLNSMGDCLNTMVLGVIEGGAITHTTTLASPHGKSREKNWMPFIVNERLHFVYNLEYLEIFALCDEHLALVNKAAKPISILRKHSGSSQLLPWGDDWICIAHVAARGGQRAFIQFPIYYLHRFVIISREFKLQSVSRLFFLSKRGIEFCAGLAIDGDRVLISFGGDQDSTANILEISREQVVDLF